MLTISLRPGTQASVKQSMRRPPISRQALGDGCSVTPPRADPHTPQISFSLLKISVLSYEPEKSSAPVPQAYTGTSAAVW